VQQLRRQQPYAEFADFPDLVEAVRTDCGKSERNAFEPACGKGAAARAVFYFCLRYPGAISAIELPPDRCYILLNWHEQDPVSQWERHRNAAIYARQGNRNPFIEGMGTPGDARPPVCNGASLRPEVRGDPGRPLDVAGQCGDVAMSHTDFCRRPPPW
jgi:hypothetical protein